jgi:hypothetical protein
MTLKTCDDCGGFSFLSIDGSEEERIRCDQNPCTCKVISCTCADSVIGLKALYAVQVNSTVHGVGYDGPKFRFCPWCAAPIKKEKPS